jgi:membrane protease YdiL (CAAX protease family)
VSTLVFDIFLVGMVLWVVHRKGAGLRQLGFRGPKRSIIADWGPWPGMLILVVVAYFGAIASVSFYSLAAEAVGLDQLLPSQQLPDSFFDHAGVIAITGLSVVFGAPLAEEIFFRGFLFGGLRAYLRLPLAALATGLLFSLAHGDPGLIIPFTMVGAILAFTYERSGTLLAPISVHFIFNGISFLVLLLVPSVR